ncbi:recombinase family protein [Rhodopirellula sallentina]|uniref:Resolvase n=1 Tax=Rhodopirellula sallentina SM41 TaxID=1263870 RepID=M5UBJ2_9BACT|nr:recombinase family protein [Rhodopirellula sallentina]EMI55206.1 Resolvase [Rhodopirellula sallentina SM41]
MAIVYSYIRFSSKKQEQGDSLRRQRELGDKWIEKNNHTKGNLTLEDTGVSAFRGKNRHEGALKRFLDEVQSGSVKKGSILLVENLDRLSREGIHPALNLFGKILEAGIDIVVLQPYEQHYTKQSANDLIGMMIPLIHFYLAYLESQKKSNRLKEAWTEKRRRAEEGEKFNKRCPSWLRWSDSKRDFVKRDGWEAIPFIFQKSAEGYGHHRILAGLHEHYKPLGTSGTWNGSFINSVLADRSVLGELQPKEIDDDGNRVPVGPPIPNYYPRIIDEDLWYQSKSSRSTRKKQKGPNSKFLNLFTGLVFCAQDQSSMHVYSSPDSKDGRVRRMVSYKHKSKQPGAWPVSIEYEKFEKAVLSFLSELNPDDLRPHHDNSALQAKERERAGLAAHLKQLQETLADPKFSNVKALAQTLKDVEEKLSALDQEIDKLNQAMHRQNPIAEAQGVLAVLEQPNEREEAERLRLKVKMLLPEIVESIWVKPEKYRSKSVAVIQLNFLDGGAKHLLMLPDRFIGTRSVTIRTGEKADTLPHFPYSISWATDLRHPEGHLSWSAKDIMEKSDSALHPVPTAKPRNIAEAAEKWLAQKRNEVDAGSYRTIPAAIRRTVRALGKELKCADLNKQKWGKWKRTLKRMLSNGELTVNTARVNYNRSKELLAWLFEEGLTTEWPGWKESAAQVLSGE